MNLEESIVATLRYSDYFAFPLTFPELHRRLLKCQADQVSVRKALSTLVAKKSIGKTGEYYHLPHRSQLVATRRKKQAHAKLLYVRARELAAKLSHIPGVLALYTTGSLAVENTEPDADIDFMVITRSGRLWTTRLLLTLYTSLVGLRRTPHSDNNSGKLCLNLYLTLGSLELPQTKQNIYTAYELIQAVPLYDPHDTHTTLLAENKWITRFLPNYSLPKRGVPSSIDEGTTLSLFPPIEYLFYRLQYFYMKRKITHEYITRDTAFFHPHNPGDRILKMLKQ